MQPGSDTRWVATLSNGEMVVGRPSWLETSPHNDQPISDWRRLMLLCETDNLRLTSLTLYVNGRAFPAPLNKPAYGYSETLVTTVNKTQPTGIESHNIMWPEEYDPITKRHRVLKVIKVYTSGLLEHWTYAYKWLPCMIGEQLWDTEGVLHEQRD